APNYPAGPDLSVRRRTQCDQAMCGSHSFCAKTRLRRHDPLHQEQRIGPPERSQVPARSASALRASYQTARGAAYCINDPTGSCRGSGEAVMRRGVRADEAAQGSGLGLAIVRDLAEVYGGSISLEDSPMGGARARLTLPAQDAA